MKTRQPKSRLKCIALLLLGLVATIGCQKTELDNTPAQQENFQRFRIEHYTVEDLQRNGKMETELGKLLKLLAKGGQVHAKDGTSPVGTDSIKYVEEYATGKHSYNFPMPADSLGRMRNLAMVSRNGSGYDAHVVVYGFSEEEFLQLDEVELSERGAMFSPVLDLDSLSQDPSGLEKVHAGWMCVEVWGVETLTEHNGDLHGVSHDGTCVVPGCRFGQTVPVLISSDCTLDTGGGTSDGGSWYPNPNGGQGNPHPGPGNGNVTTPASCNGCSYFDPENPGEQCLALAQAAQLVSALGLNSGQAAMIRSNCAFGSQLYDYLNNGGDEAFAIAAVEAMPDGEVDWDDEVILDSTFVSSSVHCIHNKMKSNSANIYSNMLSHFSSTTQKNITFSIGSSIGTDWGITNGNPSIPNDYNIIIHENIIENNGSNLMRYVALCHELIHAFMFDSLEDVGLITFDSTGSPILNVNCPTSNVNLNALNVKDRFVSLICAMNTAGILTQDWSHDLFNSTVFSIQDYRQQLENLILNDYDWNNEGAVFVNNAVSTFGTNWKQEVAKAVSWIGLENTDEYSTYLNSYSTQPMKFLYINDIRNIISVTNNNCP